ncbi:hypothetical protein A0J61_10684 [Choanephora cucurbitarum]|uniref:Uncharacterized protein n=1 Tax=Choanephora cucurbitarum TaxID=101091 RepID=A0A1C7MWS0_9FUNG|nr:hypothetical protein A0J61_10684 [Choanephora cucurbitarum]
MKKGGKTKAATAGSKRKAEDVSGSSCSKSRPSTTSKSVDIAPFLPLLPPLTTELKCDRNWLIDDINVSNELMQIKSNCINKHNKNEKMKPVEYLSFLTQARHLKLVKSIEFEKFQVRLPSVIDTWLSELVNLCRDGEMRSLRVYLASLISSEEAKTDDELLLVASALSSLVPRYKTWEKDNAVEDTFVKNHFADVLDIILGQDQDNILKYEWCNKKLSSCILKPDYTLYFEDKEAKEVATFIVEVKAPSRNKNSNDFIKLGFTLKSMLDSLIKRGMRSPRVLGLLVDGFDCYLYMMQIDNEAIYQMVELRRFSLPKSEEELLLLRNLFEATFLVKTVSLEVFKEFEGLTCGESDLLPLCRFAAE